MAARLGTACFAATFTLLASSIAAAQSPPPAPSLPEVSAPASAGQRALAVGVLPGPQGPSLRARICATTPCSLAASDARPLALRDAPDAAQIAGARLTVLHIARNRTVVHIDAGQGVSRWQALVAAPVGAGAEPLVLWSGRTPPYPTDGQDQADALQITEPAADGTVNVLVGQTHPDIEICGRPSLLSPRVVYAGDLSLKQVKLQRLSQQEREKATRLEAVALTSEQPAPLGRLLAAQGASSAIGSPLAVVDANPDTVWSEARGGEGRGEFLTLRAPAEVPLVSMTFTFRPPNADVPDGAAPRQFWLATPDKLFEVAVPEDAWKTPGSRYQVRFPEPLHASCVAMVLGDASAPRGQKDIRVTVAEIQARSEWDGAADVQGLVAALAGGGERARSAAQVLMRGGEPAQRASLQGYAALDEAGRQLVLDVLDTAPCELAAPLVASVLASPSARVRQRAQDRVRRCGRYAAPALTAVLDHGPGCDAGYDNPKLCRTATRSAPGHLGAARLAAGEELASVSPLIAVQHLAPLLEGADAPSRSWIRASLARATRHEDGRQALAALMVSAPPARALDLLRAVQDRFEQMPWAAATTFGKLATADTDERTRYLLCPVAARLAALGHDPAARYLFDRILHDPSAMVRAHAIDVAAPVQALHPAIGYALEDPNVRVRAAAAHALRGDAAASDWLVRRLMIDEWPAIRADSAKALASGGGGAQADDALARALSDGSHAVRGAAVTALGERRAVAHAAEVRERAEDSEEPVSVRIQAVRALGRMCDPGALDTLTIFARRSADGMSPEAASGLGRVAIVALGRLHPPDLAKRLEPLMTGQRVPAQVRAAAESALHETDVCKPSR